MLTVVDEEQSKSGGSELSVSIMLTGSFKPYITLALSGKTQASNHSSD